MDRPNCSQLKTQLQEIKELKAEFDLELQKIKDTKNIAPTLMLETEIRDGLAEIRVGLHDFFLEQQMKEAEQIMQKDFLGPEAIAKTFDFKPEIKDIPPIPFSKTELERAKELGQFLVLRIDKAPDGQPLTMKAMNELKGGKTKDGEKILSLVRYKDEDFFNKDTPKLSWALVSKEVIPDSTNKNYLEQTEVLISYVKDSVFKGKTMSAEYQEAINEFKQAKEEIKELMSSDWQLAAKKLEQLKINQLTRHTPCEALYDILLKKEKTGEYLLSNNYTWTSRRASDGRFVGVGHFSVGGAFVFSYSPDYFYGDMGVIFSHRGNPMINKNLK